MKHPQGFNDPIGPGTYAWDSYEKALTAYARVPNGQHDTHNKQYKSYSNYRTYMITRLRKANTPTETIKAWCEQLKADCKSGAMDEHGEWK